MYAKQVVVIAVLVRNTNTYTENIENIRIVKIYNFFLIYICEALRSGVKWIHLGQVGQGTSKPLKSISMYTLKQQ